MVKINCSNETVDFFTQIEKIKILTLKKNGAFWEGYMGIVIGDCAFVPFEGHIEIYEADEWKFGVKRRNNEG